MAIANDALAATGRRKQASARVTIVPGSGKIKVNGETFEKYFDTEAVRGFILQPLALTGKVQALDITASVKGGGKKGQAGAVRHGIARALVKMFEDECKGILKANGMLTRDPREKERKKPGQPGARKRYQFSKR